MLFVKKAVVDQIVNFLDKPQTNNFLNTRITLDSELLDYLNRKPLHVFLIFLQSHFYRNGFIFIRPLLLATRCYAFVKSRVTLVLSVATTMLGLRRRLFRYFKFRRKIRQKRKEAIYGHKIRLADFLISRSTDLYEGDLCFRLTMHKRQQYFIWSDYPLWNLVVYSSGRLLSPISKKLKYYKKIFRNVSILLVRCRNLLRYRLHYLYILFCKNYNFKQYSWVKRYMTNVKPTIVYTVLTHSWQYSPKGIRRVKRTVYRNLLKTG